MNTLNHVAFIMDGNGRWGKRRGKGRNYGHIKGVETVKKVVKASIKFKIPIVTFYVFSSENWRRPKKEVNFLLNLIKTYFLKEILNALKKIKKNINFKNLEKNLYTKNLPFPDILVRTGGHNRLSNFMLWQLAYSEIFFLNKLWPEFTNSDFSKIISKFKKTKRNFGGI